MIRLDSGADSKVWMKEDGVCNIPLKFSEVFLFAPFALFKKRGIKMKKTTLSKLIKVSVLSAMAFILMLLEFPLPIFPSFLKIDFSDLPALLGAFAMGPIAGIVIEFMKNLLNVAIQGSATALIGEAANFVVGAAFVGVAGLVYQRSKTRKNAVISLSAGIVAMVLVASVANYFVFLPLYEKVLHFPVVAMVEAGKAVFKGVTDFNTFVAYSIALFNLFKGFIVALITFITYKKLSPILHREA
jgi:riboflavin transporter FmnP